MSKLIAISQAIFLSALLIGSSSHAKDSFFVTDIEGDHGIYISYDDYPSIHLVGHFSLPLAGMFANYQLGIEKVVVSEGVQPLNYVPFFNRVSGTGGLMFRAWWGRM